MSENKLDIIMRTKDSAETLKLSIDSILEEIFLELTRYDSV
jgi:hypothetical protein